MADLLSIATHYKDKIVAYGECGLGKNKNYCDSVKQSTYVVNFLNIQTLHLFLLVCKIFLCGENYI